MEYALGVQIRIPFELASVVLILILVEYALGDHLGLMERTFIPVLILILVEYALGANLLDAIYSSS